MSEVAGKRAYRIYRIEETGRIETPPVEICCADDTEAIDRAKQVLDGADLEVWNLARLVVRLKRLDEPNKTPPSGTAQNGLPPRQGPAIIGRVEPGSASGRSSPT